MNALIEVHPNVRTFRYNWSATGRVDICIPIIVIFFTGIGLWAFFAPQGIGLGLMVIASVYLFVVPLYLVYKFSFSSIRVSTIGIEAVVFGVTCKRLRWEEVKSIRRVRELDESDEWHYTFYVTKAQKPKALFYNAVWFNDRIQNLDELLDRLNHAANELRIPIGAVDREADFKREAEARKWWKRWVPDMVEEPIERL